MPAPRFLLLLPSISLLALGCGPGRASEDAGPGAEDAGAPPPADASAAPTDGGVEAADAGVAPADGGVSLRPLTLRAARPLVIVPVGDPAQPVELELVRGPGFSAAVLVTAAGLPSGLSADTATIAPGASTATLHLRAALDARLGDRRVSFRAMGGADTSSVAIVLEVAAAGSSTTPLALDLIQAARATGQLGDEDALRFEMFAAFQDARLPAAFRGPSGGLETGVSAEIAARWDSLSPATQDELWPFFVPPIYAESWYAQASHHGRARLLDGPPCAGGPDPTWTFVENPSGHTRVWYRRSDPLETVGRAHAVADEVDNRIWPSLVTGAGLAAPLDDSDAFCNGGNERLDIYLAPMGVLGHVATDLGETDGRGLASKHAPVFMLVDLDHAVGEDLKGTLAHEFVHACQWAYDLPMAEVRYGWLLDSTANWGVDAVYQREIQTEHRKPGNSMEAFLDEPNKSLFAAPGPKDVRPYGKWLFHLFLARTLGPSTIGAIWRQAESTTSVIVPVDRAIQGGLAEQWPKFALAAWNNDPVASSSFEAWDDVRVGSRPQDGLNPMEIQKDQETAVAFELEPLSSEVQRFVVRDTTLRTLIFRNGFTYRLERGDLRAALGQSAPQGTGYLASDLSASARKGRKIQALLKIGGVWQAQPEDWTDRPYRAFCRDDAAEHVEEIVVVYSYAAFEDGAPSASAPDVPSLFTGNDLGCARLQSSGEIRGTNFGSALDIPRVDVAASGFTARGQPVGIDQGGKHAFLGYGFSASAGSVRATVSGVDIDGCVWSGGTSVPIPMTAPILSYSGVVDGPAKRGFTWQVYIPASYLGQASCPPGIDVPPPNPYLAITWGPIFDPESSGMYPKVSGNGLQIAGSNVHDTADDVFNYVFDFLPVP
ncbi:MAG: hypothetical protein U1E65_13075 [Myxococcota bacterium]